MEREKLKEKYSAEAASYRCQAEKEGKTLLLLSALIINCAMALQAKKMQSF
jgi:hypothetical protein